MSIENVTRKVAYTPSQELRYELSLDPISRERFKALMEIHKELQAEIPDIPISFCFFGSLVKGKVLTEESAKHTDIDLAVKYDLASMEITAKKLSISFYKFLREFKQIIETFVCEKLKEKKEKLGFKREPNIHLFVNPIDGVTIGESIADFFRNRGHYLGLALYFTVSVGEPVKKYRNLFLKELASGDKEYAEITWNMIKEVVEETERENKIPEAIRKQFPQTLEEALKFYEVEV